MPYRILRIIARLNIGGPAIHATLLSQRLDPLRFTTTLVAGTEDPSEGSYIELAGKTDLEIVRVPQLGRELSGLRDVSSLARLIRLIRTVRPHIVHTHAAKAGALGRVAAWLCRVPVVVHTYHGHVLRGYFSPRKERLFRGIERALARVSDALIAVTPRVRSELLGMGIGRDETFTVVPLGLDLARFLGVDELRGSLRRELHVAADAPLVGIVARLVPIKAHEVFLQAAEVLHARDPRIHFVIVGDGECRKPLEQSVVARGLRDVTHFLGWRADLEQIYADLDVVGLTSRNEGSPVALIEAMAAARPVVATAVGGVPDVVEHGVTGWLVAPGEAERFAAQVLEILGLPDRGRGIGLVGRARALASFGSDRLVADIEALYDRLLAGRS